MCPGRGSQEVKNKQFQTGCLSPSKHCALRWSRTRMPSDMMGTRNTWLPQPIRKKQALNLICRASPREQNLAHRCRHQIQPFWSKPLIQSFSFCCSSVRKVQQGMNLTPACPISDRNSQFFVGTKHLGKQFVYMGCTPVQASAFQQGQLLSG